MRLQARRKAVKKMAVRVRFTVVRDHLVTTAGKSNEIKNRTTSAKPYAARIAGNTPT
jgi:hypothetical protein